MTQKALETGGTIDVEHRLILDDPLPVDGPRRVRVIILLPEETEVSESEWLQAAAASPAYDFLKDPEEDVYRVSDGKAFHDEGSA
jgi:hypothetical protein